jgi:hypothetical protein
VLTLLAVSLVGGVTGIGLSFWLEPWNSVTTVAIGSIAGIAVSRALGESLGWGFALGLAVALIALGVRALVSIFDTLRRPTSIASRAWFSR